MTKIAIILYSYGYYCVKCKGKKKSLSKYLSSQNSELNSILLSALRRGSAFSKNLGTTSAGTRHWDSGMMSPIGNPSTHRLLFRWNIPETGSGRTTLVPESGAEVETADGWGTKSNRCMYARKVLKQGDKSDDCRGTRRMIRRIWATMCPVSKCSDEY